MDSMRSLNRSLPSSSTAARPAPPEQLLQAFKQAALSVTNLYKSAATDHEAIRQVGYQDALDDLLKFLDRENLGLQDGEGWRVRQWATARYDGSAHTQQSEDEDETADLEPTQRSTSPDKQAEEEDATAPQVQQEQQPRAQSATPQLPTQVPSHVQSPFQFSAGSDSIMSTDDSQTPSQESSTESRSIPVKLDLINRNKNAHKNNSRNTVRPTSRSALQTIGSKRKLPFPDISDIFNVGFDKKDPPDSGNGSGGGGSKRTRFV